MSPAPEARRSHRSFGRKPLALAALLACLAAPTAVLAVLPPSSYLDARRSADHHIQMAVTNRVIPIATPGTCLLKGTVVTVFRSRGDVLEPGTPVALAVDCMRPGDSIPTGGTLWGQVPTLEQAGFVEAYLNGADPADVVVAQWQYGVIGAPSAMPQCPEDSDNPSCP